MEKGGARKKAEGRGHACRLVFLLSLAVAYLIVPQAVFGQHAALSAMFLLTFAYTMACVAYAARQNMRNASGKGALSVAASAVGLAALSACGAAACGSIGIGIFSLAMPIAAVHFFAQYGAYLVAASILAQLFSLWKMGCLSKKAAAAVASS
ncbi:MAG: hypothetical protein WC717_05880 [Candidatus Micrarchaeia archaeon]|jgi:hypothetical protein